MATKIYIRSITYDQSDRFHQIFLCFNIDKIYVVINTCHFSYYLQQSYGLWLMSKFCFVSVSLELGPYTAW